MLHLFIILSLAMPLIWLDIFENASRSFWKEHLGERYAAYQGAKLYSRHSDRPRHETVFEKIKEAISCQIVKRGVALRKNNGVAELRQTFALRTLID